MEAVSLQLGGNHLSFKGDAWQLGAWPSREMCCRAVQQCSIAENSEWDQALDEITRLREEVASLRHKNQELVQSSRASTEAANLVALKNQLLLEMVGKRATRPAVSCRNTLLALQLAISNLDQEAHKKESAKRGVKIELLTDELKKLVDAAPIPQ